MLERSPYGILDLGTGYGGPYIDQLLSLNRPVVSIDVSTDATRRLSHNFRELLIVNGNAKDLPFPNASFSVISIYFPHGALLQPGLQSDAPYKGSHSNPHHEGWYSEFARVLEPRGKLIIFGDSWLNVAEVLLFSTYWFEEKESRLVDRHELEEIGTDQAQDVLSSKRLHPQDVSSIAYKVVLENIKPF